MTIISLLLLASLLPHLTSTDRVNVGIVNGTEAKPHSRPYMVSLQSNKKHVCGGFLISNRFVMTAAHCMIKNDKVTAVVGMHDLKKSTGSDSIRVKSYHKHPDFNQSTFQNDIMLLRLEKEVELHKNVKIISIPTQEGDIKPDSVCSVAGWGRLSLKGKKTTRLMEADVKIMNNIECQHKWIENYVASEMMEILEVLWFVGTLQSASLPLVTEKSAIVMNGLKFIQRFQHIFHGSSA
ncbi:granzyme 1 [Labeo rohita]|uniref:trypsin n=1 Tax=Labeo rohita TaxID=84645 RepID=A0A498MBR9_LABRO|nr:granzyme 1 [Labeo rohita]